MEYIRIYGIKKTVGDRRAMGQQMLLAIFTIVMLVLVAVVVIITIVVSIKVATSASFNTWKQTEAILKTTHGKCLFRV